MLTTSNYGLKKPEGSDVVNIDDLNYNADIIDTKIKNIFDNLGDAVKKDGTIQTGLNADTVDGKHADDFVLARNIFNGDTTNIDSFNTAKTWVGRCDSNTTGTKPPTNYTTVLNVGADGTSNFQIGGAYDGSNKMFYRTRHNIDAVYQSWKRLLNEDDYNTLFQSVSNGKSAVANAITDKGGTANSGMTFDQLASAISNLASMKYVSGSAVMTTGSTHTVNVNVGFQPRAVLIYNYTLPSSSTDKDINNFAMPEIGLNIHCDRVYLQSVTITSTGFTGYDEWNTSGGALINYVCFK